MDMRLPFHRLRVTFQVSMCVQHVVKELSYFAHNHLRSEMRPFVIRLADRQIYYYY